MKKFLVALLLVMYGALNAQHPAIQKVLMGVSFSPNSCNILYSKPRQELLYVVTSTSPLVSAEVFVIKQGADTSMQRVTLPRQFGPNSNLDQVAIADSSTYIFAREWKQTNNGVAGVITMVDYTTGNVVNTLSFDVEKFPKYFRVAADGSYIAVVSERYGINSIHVFATNTAEELYSKKIGDEPVTSLVGDVTFSHNKQQLYFVQTSFEKSFPSASGFASHNDSLMVVDIALKEIVARKSLGKFPAMYYDDKLIYQLLPSAQRNLIYCTLINNVVRPNKDSVFFFMCSIDASNFAMLDSIFLFPQKADSTIGVNVSSYSKPLLFPEKNLLFTSQDWKTNKAERERGRVWSLTTGAVTKSCPQGLQVCASTESSLQYLTAQGVYSLDVTNGYINLSAPQGHVQQFFTEVPYAWFTQSNQLISCGAEGVCKVRSLNTYSIHSYFQTSIQYQLNRRPFISNKSSSVFWEGNIYESSSGKIIRQLPASVYYSGLFTASDSTIIVSSDIVREWNKESGDVVRQFLTSNKTEILSLAISPNQHQLVGGGNDYTLYVWSTQSTVNQASPLIGHAGSVTFVRYSKNGSYIASCSKDKTARIWDANTLVSKAVLKGHSKPVTGAVFSNSGEYVLTCSEDSTLRLWDANNGNLLQIVATMKSEFRSMDISPSGKQIVTTMSNGDVVLWSADSLGFSIPLSVSNSYKETSSVSINPNPCNNLCRIESSFNPTLIDVYDMYGRKILDIPISETPSESASFTYTLNTEHFQTGAYTIVLKNGDVTTTSTFVVYH